MQMQEEAIAPIPTMMHHPAEGAAAATPQRQHPRMRGLQTSSTGMVDANGNPIYDPTSMPDTTTGGVPGTYTDATGMASDGTTTTQQATAQQLLRLLTQIINRVGNDPINMVRLRRLHSCRVTQMVAASTSSHLREWYSVPMIAAIENAMKALFNQMSGVNTTEIEAFNNTIANLNGTNLYLNDAVAYQKTTIPRPYYTTPSPPPSPYTPPPPAPPPEPPSYPPGLCENMQCCGRRYCWGV